MPAMNAAPEAIPPAIPPAVPGTIPAAIPLGFAEPSLDSQRVFRAVLEALARPGQPQRLAGLADAPRPLTPELAAIALALADHEAPLWLDARLAAAPDVAAFLRFHTGAPVVTDPAAAAFALVADPADCPPPEAFAEGTPEDPDRSTTLVLAVGHLTEGIGMTLAGPGIPGRVRLGAGPLPADFAARLRRNAAGFPLGLDHLLAAPGLVAGLPRSTRLVAEG
ncbi:phosphonate C-P lyase system protein PhnH [Roseomonas sp. NAR14]|uniref:Phosphonate C-P lyase system protein PhnH n=1 Tax=Roseomonas acroporae TaxID=2937791 RepID=A0A9X1Y9T3_9PROT|nr:phosphonate C-P lyase system protein PhnH [Roseomonas acroporae]MCK8785725.1 phosphonate C-P lyase system protein PhnH [Roseomonas acroporae]